jgi:8-oxo-dGTP pyrophosphatase MutT (NUDIX family)
VERPVLCTAAVLTNPQGKVLMLLRGPGMRYYPGHWCFPGGKVEPGETLIQCVAREVREEIGLVLPVTDFSLWTFNENIDVDKGLHRVCMVYQAPLRERALPRIAEAGLFTDIGLFDLDTRPPRPLLPPVEGMLSLFPEWKGSGR